MEIVVKPPQKFMLEGDSRREQGVSGVEVRANTGAVLL